MAVTDYVITPKDIWLTMRRVGLRDITGVLVGVIATYASYKAGNVEAGVFAGILLLWIIAGYPGRVFFMFAIITLLMIVMFSLYDPDYEVGDDTVVVEKLAVWVFYFMLIGVIKLLIESLTDRVNPPSRKTPVLPTSLRSTQNDRLAHKHKAITSFHKANHNGAKQAVKKSKRRKIQL